MRGAACIVVSFVGRPSSSVVCRGACRRVVRPHLIIRRLSVSRPSYHLWFVGRLWYLVRRIFCRGICRRGVWYRIFGV